MKSERNKAYVIACIVLALILLNLIVCGFKQKYSSRQTISQNIVYRIHTVQSGDTLWSISKQYTKADPRELIYQIQKINNTTADIYPGQTLKIP